MWTELLLSCLFGGVLGASIGAWILFSRWYEWELAIVVAWALPLFGGFIGLTWPISLPYFIAKWTLS